MTMMKEYRAEGLDFPAELCLCQYTPSGLRSRKPLSVGIWLVLRHSASRLHGNSSFLVFPRALVKLANEAVSRMRACPIPSRPRGLITERRS